MLKVVDITFKNGTYLENCSIFKNVDGKYVYINTDEEIKSEFQVMPWGNQWRSINFQNRDINGHSNVMNIKSYTIHSVDIDV